MPASCESNDAVFSSTENAEPFSKEAFRGKLGGKDGHDNLPERDNSFAIDSFNGEKDNDYEFTDIDSPVLDVPTQLTAARESPPPQKLPLSKTRVSFPSNI
jgi:hypothetical protein